MYLQALTGHDEDVQLDVARWVRDTERWSLAHLKELFIAVIVLGQDYLTTVQRLRDMQENRLTSRDDERDDSMTVGQML